MSAAVESVRFVSESPLRRARRYVDADLAGRASASELQWLHGNPVMWLRALECVQYDVEAHIAKNRRDLASLKPPGGRNPSQEYLDAKAEVDRRSQGRIHFRRILETRKQEVVALLGTSRPVITGDMIEVLLRIASLIEEDDVVSARDFALAVADAWHKRFGTPP